MSPASTIAIDGPAASGKSTLAERLAERLGYLYLDTGAMYRAVTLAALRTGIPVEDEQAVTALARTIALDIRPPTVADGRQYDVLLDGEDVTWAIRTEEVDAHVSQVSMYPGVREAMGRRQREIGGRGRVVMAGRDIGTVILPQADLKIYLDASVDERARRRQQELAARGEERPYAEVLEAMRERDRLDSTRALAPLRPALDAAVLDTTGLTIDQVVARALELARGRKSVDVRLPWKVRLFRAVGRPVFRLLFHILSDVETVGKENVPERGGYLVSANHLSIIDPPLIIAFWPRPLEAAGAVDVLDRPFQGWLMRSYGAVAVHRGEADRAVLEAIIARLNAGLPVLLDPEGRRSHVAGMQQARPGVAYLAARSGVPVVPVGVTGTESATAAWRRLRRPRLRMVIGKPLHLPPIDLRSPERKQALRANTDRVMRAIAALLPPEYRGVYGHPSE